MHNRLWLSLLLAVFLALSGCAKEDAAGSTADSISPSADGASAPAPEPPAAAVDAVESDANKKTEQLLKDNIASPEKARSEATEPKAVRKKESAPAAENEASTPGDDMERMD
jgi:hypothetical protein